MVGAPALENPGLVCDSTPLIEQLSILLQRAIGSRVGTTTLALVRGGPKAGVEPHAGLSALRGTPLRAGFKGRKEGRDVGLGQVKRRLAQPSK